MKKILFSILCILLSSVAMGQTKDEQLKRIRAIYTQAKQQVADNGKDGQAPLDMHIHVSNGSMVSEDFALDDDTDVHYYFIRSKKEPYTDFLEEFSCYFISEYWTSHGHDRTREFLLDPEDGHLLFAYMKGETDGGFIVETRYYYDAKGNLIHQIHKTGNEEFGLTEGGPDSHSWNTGNTEYGQYVIYLDIFKRLMTSQGLLGTSNETHRPTASKADRLKTIRSAYAEAKQKIEQDKKAETPHHITVVSHDQTIENYAPETIELNYYFDEGEHPKCYFISYHKSSMMFDFYDEYLFDPKTHDLSFTYSRGREEGVEREWRYYFDENGRCIERLSNAEEIGDGYSEKVAADKYLQVFKILVDNNE